MLRRATTEHQKERRLRWKPFAVGVFATVILSILMAASRPQWRTVRIPAGKDETGALVVQYPVDWQRVFGGDDVEPTLFLAPPKPTGLARWWNTHVLKMDDSTWGTGHATIYRQQRPAINAVDGRKELEMVARTVGMNWRRDYRDVKTGWSTQSGMLVLNVEAYGEKGRSMLHNTNMRLVLLHDFDPARHRSNIITVRMYAAPANYNRSRPIIDEIIRRLRLVQDK